VVRGLDAHAWVEVYFPGHGWVKFDPTPGDGRDDVHTDRLEEARENGNEDADTEESADVPVRDESSDDPEDDPNDPSGPDPDDPNEPDTPDDPNEPSEPNGSPNEPANGTNESPADRTEGTESNDGESLVTVTRETAALGIVLLFGFAVGVRRTDATTRARRELGVYWHGRRRDSDRDAERAFARLERLLARQYRPRRRSESARAYLAALSAAADDATDAEPIDPRTELVVDRYERATYGGGISRADADEAIEIVDDIARESLPVVGRLR